MSPTLLLLAILAMSLTPRALKGRLFVEQTMIRMAAVYFMVLGSYSHYNIKIVVVRSAAASDTMIRSHTLRANSRH